MLPGVYNNNVQIVQTRDYVAIVSEMIHDARIVPMDGRPHGTVRRWMGDSRGRWDGPTLVVDTINFSDKTDLRGASEHLHLVERFTRGRRHDRLPLHRRRSDDVDDGRGRRRFRCTRATSRSTNTRATKGTREASKEFCARRRCRGSSWVRARQEGRTAARQEFKVGRQEGRKARHDA